MSFLLLVIERSKPGDTDTLRLVVYLCINRVCCLLLSVYSLRSRFVQLCPDYQGLELGIGESLLQKAIAQSTGRKMDAIKADFKEVGDLGLVAMVCSFLPIHLLLIPDLTGRRTRKGASARCSNRSL